MGDPVTAPRLVLHHDQRLTEEVPVRGGGYAWPVHGIDDEGYALDPNGEIEPQRAMQARLQALGLGRSWQDIAASLPGQEQA